MTENKTPVESGPRLVLPPVGVWSQHLEYVPTVQAQELVVELEELDYGAIWLPEAFGRDVFAALALLLDRTTRIIGASGVANIYSRDAPSMVGAANALTEAFPERMLLGLGVGHRNLVEDMRGHSYHKPLSAMRTYLGAMDAAPYFSQRPTTPVRKVLAALGPKMLALAGEFAEGALTYFVPPEHTAYARGALGEGPTLCVEQAVLLESDPTRAREIARGHTAIYLALPNYANNLRRLGYTEADLAGAGSDRLVDAVVAWGTEDEVVARVESHLQAGADHVCVQALSVRRNVPATQWRELAPALRAVSRRPVIR